MGEWMDRGKDHSSILVTYVALCLAATIVSCMYVV